MKKRTYTFEFEDPDLAEVFRKNACDGFDHRIYAQRITYSDGSKIPPRILVTGTDSIIYDMSLMKVLGTRSHEYGGKLVAVNGKPYKNDGTPWEWKLSGNEVIFIFQPPKVGRLCLPTSFNYNIFYICFICFAFYFQWKFIFELFINFSIVLFIILDTSLILLNP